MNKLLECSKGPYRFIMVPSGGGGIDSPAVVTDHDHDHIKNETLAKMHWRPGEVEKAKVNAALFAAAYDHALIWWAEKFGYWQFLPRTDGIKVINPGGEWFDYLPIDPFGFPGLTDDLRARLIAEMEAAHGDRDG